MGRNHGSGLSNHALGTPATHKIQRFIRRGDWPFTQRIPEPMFLEVDEMFLEADNKELK